MIPVSFNDKKLADAGYVFLEGIEIISGKTIWYPRGLGMFAATNILILSLVGMVICAIAFFVCLALGI